MIKRWKVRSIVKGLFQLNKSIAIHISPKRLDSRELPMLGLLLK